MVKAMAGLFTGLRTGWGMEKPGSAFGLWRIFEECWLT